MRLRAAPLKHLLSTRDCNDDRGRATAGQGHACLLITGAPGAGKSTISRLIADQLTRSALMDSFFVARLVASGYVWPLGEPADEAARQVRLQNTNLCALASNFADAGFTPIIDIVLPDGRQLDTYRKALASRRLLLAFWIREPMCAGTAMRSVLQNGSSS